MHLTNLIIPILIFLTTLPPSHSSHFIKPQSKHPLNNDVTKEYFTPTHPLPTDVITKPSCSTPLLTNQPFANTYNTPPVTVPYKPATCHWSHAVLTFQAQVKGEQYDRIATRSGTKAPS